MEKKKKISLVLIGILILIGTLFALNFWAEKRVTRELESKFGSGLRYENIDVDILRGRIIVEGPQIRLDNFQLKLDKLEIGGFEYFEFISNEKIIVQTIKAKRPEIFFYTKSRDTSDTSSKFNSDILVKNLIISQGILGLAETDSSAYSFYTEIRKLQLEEIMLNEETIKEEVPFTYENPEIVADSVYLNLDKQHFLSLRNIEFHNSQFSARDLRVTPKFSKTEFQARIPYEKDRYDLLVEKIEAENLQWEFLNDSLHLRNDLLQLEGANLQVYRDKLHTDDTRIKTLYSEKIRNLPFKIDIGKLELINSRIVYEERIRESMGPGTVYFTNLYATVSGLTNVGMNQPDFPTTIMEARANLMGESVLDFHLEFNVNDLQDRYSFSGNSGPVSSEGINNFLRPALNIEAEGGIESLAFNFNGDEEGATGDMRLSYRDFKVTILRDDGKKKDGILSAIANFFVNNKALDEEATREDLEVTRDKTKSFWNLVWSCIEKGAFKTLL